MKKCQWVEMSESVGAKSTKTLAMVGVRSPRRDRLWLRGMADGKVVWFNTKTGKVRKRMPRNGTEVLQELGQSPAKTSTKRNRSGEAVPRSEEPMHCLKRNRQASLGNVDEHDTKPVQAARKVKQDMRTHLIDNPHWKFEDWVSNSALANNMRGELPSSDVGAEENLLETWRQNWSEVVGPESETEKEIIETRKQLQRTRRLSKALSSRRQSHIKRRQSLRESTLRQRERLLQIVNPSRKGEPILAKVTMESALLRKRTGQSIGRRSSVAMATRRQSSVGGWAKRWVFLCRADGAWFIVCKKDKTSDETLSMLCLKDVTSVTTESEAENDPLSDVNESNSFTIDASGRGYVFKASKPAIRRRWLAELKRADPHLRIE